MHRTGAIARRLVATAFVAFAACFVAVSASADEVRYDVVVDAPAPLQALIQANLGLARYRDEDGRRGRIDEDQLRRLFEEGKEEIARLVATEGYYAPTVDADLDETGDRRVARYRIVPNARTTVASIDLRFVGPIERAPTGEPPDLAELRGDWTLAVGNAFRQDEWETNKRRLLQGLLVKTYPFATLTRSEARVDVRTSTAALTVVIASGPAVRFGPLVIVGLERYPAEVVRNLDPVDLGELYTQQKVFDFQQKLAASGFFARADVSIDAVADPGSDPRSPFVAPKAADGETPLAAAPAAALTTDAAPAAATNDSAAPPPSPLPREVTLPLRVVVDENKRQTASIGLGYTTNYGPRATLGYNIVDFLGGAKQLRTNVSFDRLNQTAGVDLLFPTTAAGDRDSLSAALTRTEIQQETTRSGTLSAKRAWGPDDSERFNSIDYIHERKDITGIPQALAETLGVTHGVTLRRTDSLLSPTSGYIVGGQVGAGVRVTDGQPFARVYGKGLRYQPIGSENTLLVRLELGAIAGRDTTTLPSALLFRAGGAGSVRGYGYQSLGVREGDAIVGGRYLATGTLELVHWLGPKFPQWGVAAFVDAGNAGNVLTDLSPVVGYGLGARYRSPVGTLDLDVAHGIENGTTRIHFSLGVTF